MTENLCEEINGVTWLMNNYVEHQTSKTEGDFLFEAFLKDGGKESSKILGKLVASLFPSVSIVKTRSKTTGKVTPVYLGLQKVDNDFTFYDFNELVKLIPPEYVVVSFSATQVHIGKFTGDIINGNRVMKEIVFYNNNKWKLHIAMKNICLSDLRISDSYNMTKKSIINVCDIVDKILLCKGKLKNEHNTEINPKTNVVEHWSVDGDENSSFVTVRSLKCRRCVTFYSSGKICRTCQQNLIPSGGKKRKQDPHCELDVKVSKDDDHDDFLTLTKDDHNDMRLIINQIIPSNAHENFVTLLLDQIQNLQCNPNQRRWNKKVLRMCLTMWCRSRKAYEDLVNSKFLILPSGRLLQYYKNCVEQTSGFNKEVFIWMRQEAEKRNLPPQGWLGGILFDEMSIQEDLVMVKSHGETKLVGFVDLGEESTTLQIMSTGTKEKKLATHVVQFLFLGQTGFRFPIAHFPTEQVKTGDLHFMFWKAVKYLHLYGFNVLFASMDGAQTNRDFVKMFFNGASPVEARYSTANIWFPLAPPIVMIMDYSHVIKRVRNNLHKSGDGKQFKRNLHFEDYSIYWDYWYKAFQWDRSTNAFPIHHTLTHDHFFLTQESKMRNKLAEDVLNTEMLHLMEVYQSYLGEEGSYLNGAVSLLKHTSILVTNFRDMRPITDTSDVRLKNNLEVLHWFQAWEVSVVNNNNLTASQRDKYLISAQTREDLNSCIIGFEELCHQRLKVSDGSVIPGRVNSDPIENIFCQQRGLHNGANSNPNYAQYAKTMNTIVLGQPAISRKSNAGVNSNGAEPFCLLSNRALNSRKQLSMTSQKLDVK